jgi:hypothetical protein
MVLGIYHGAFTVVRRTLFRYLCNIPMFESLAVPQKVIPYVQMGWRWLVLDIACHIAVSERIISVHFILHDANKIASRKGSYSYMADELIAIPSYTFLLNKGLWFLVRARVFKMYQNILHDDENVCSHKNVPNSLIHTQSTPHMNLEHHVMVVRGLIW